MPKSSPSLDYQTLSTELEIILEALRRPDIGVDEAVTLYEQGLKLVAALEKHLTEAENKITALKSEAEQGKA